MHAIASCWAAKRNPRGSGLPGGKAVSSLDEKHPWFGAMRKKGESFLPSVSLTLRTRPSTLQKGRVAQSPADMAGWEDLALLSLNPMAKQWFSHKMSFPALCCSGLCMLLVYTETKLEIPTQTCFYIGRDTRPCRHWFEWLCGRPSGRVGQMASWEMSTAGSSLPKVL